MVKVIASSIRKGNIIELENGLYSVISAESFFPGKGTPTTQIDCRRLSDGVKTQVRYRTTEQVEKAFVEDKDYTYLYGDDDGFTFMDQENFEQVMVPKDVMGDQASYLQENMVVRLGLYNGVPVTIILPFNFTGLVFTALLAWISLGEIITRETFIGSVIIIASSLLVAREEAKRQGKVT